MAALRKAVEPVMKIVSAEAEAIERAAMAAIRMVFVFFIFCLVSVCGFLLQLILASDFLFCLFTALKDLASL